MQVMLLDRPTDHRLPIASPFTLIHTSSSGAASPLELLHVEGEGEIRYLDGKKAVAAHEAS